MAFYLNNGQPRRRGSFIGGLIIAVIALISYFGSQEYNTVTKEKQYISLTPNQEIALGLQAAPSMAREYGGESTDPQQVGLVKRVGQTIATKSAAKDTQWKFDFHVLADANTINAFALPGGQVFITAGLLNRMKTEAELAGVLAHEIGHVVGRHAAAQIAKQQLSQGLTTATVVATGDQGSGMLAAMVGQLLNLRYGRGDELAADALGVRLMSEAGYDPRAMLGVMRILASTHKAGANVEFFQTHPNPENRISNIEAAIATQYPNGVPAGLSQ